MLDEHVGWLRMRGSGWIEDDELADERQISDSSEKQPDVVSDLLHGVGGQLQLPPLNKPY